MKKQKFVRIIKKTIANNDDLKSFKLLNMNGYIYWIYKTGYADKFIRDLKKKAYILEDSHFFWWLKNEMWVKGLRSSNQVDFDITPDLREALIHYRETPGVYCFLYRNEFSAYIGSSSNLYMRIIPSFWEKFGYNYEEIYVQIAPTQSLIDALVYELYLINKIKPLLNLKSKYGGNLTLELKKEPGFSAPILCADIIEEEENFDR